MNAKTLEMIAAKFPLSKDTKRLNSGPQETAAEARPAGPHALIGRSRATGRRVRQRTKPKLNKLETEYGAILATQFPNYPRPRAHAKTYVLANGLRFTPDFTVSLWPKAGPTQETAWEVKGPHAWDDALVKLKVAAHEWPEVRWVLVWKENGQWQEQEILA